MKTSPGVRSFNYCPTQKKYTLLRGQWYCSLLWQCGIIGVSVGFLAMRILDGWVLARVDFDPEIINGVFNRVQQCRRCIFSGLPAPVLPLLRTEKSKTTCIHKKMVRRSKAVRPTARIARLARLASIQLTAGAQQADPPLFDLPHQVRDKMNRFEHALPNRPSKLPPRPAGFTPNLLCFGDASDAHTSTDDNMLGKRRTPLPHIQYYPTDTEIPLQTDTEPPESK